MKLKIKFKPFLFKGKMTEKKSFSLLKTKKPEDKDILLLKIEELEKRIIELERDKYNQDWNSSLKYKISKIGK